MSGQIRLQDIAVLYAGSPVALDKLNGTVELGRQSVQISHLTGQLNGGDISAGGSIAYRPNLQFNIALQEIDPLALSRWNQNLARWQSHTRRQSRVLDAWRPRAH